ncbi:hypothetical protein ACWEWG_31905 [Streptomyces sp. NPDC003758]
MTRSKWAFETTGPTSTSSPAAGSPTTNALTSHQLLDELVGDRLVDEDTAGGSALLARVPETGDADRRRSGEVRILEDHRRCLAAEFQVDALRVSAAARLRHVRC